MCGSLVARALKTLRDASDFILVRVSEPYIQQYGVLRVRNAPIEGCCNEGIESKRERVHGDILSLFE